MYGTQGLTAAPSGSSAARHRSEAPVAQSRYMRMSANSVRITRDSGVGRWSPADGSKGSFYAIDRLPFDYFHSQSLDTTLSLASVSCSNTPTMPASFAKFPLAFVK